MHWLWNIQYYGSIIAIISNVIAVFCTYINIRHTTADFMKQRYYLEMIKYLVSIIILFIYIWILSEII